MSTSLPLPADFITQMKQQLGGEVDLFLEALHSPTPVSIRINPSKISSIQASNTVPWEPMGHYLSSRPSFTLDPLFHAGSYYVQEAGSMLTGELIKQVWDQDEPIRILDLCAAPGGKSTHLASIVGNKGVIVSNETIRSRVGVLAENLSKWGEPNVIITNNDPEDFSELYDLFDVIVIDAPCSGEGMFRKDPDAVSYWNLDQVDFCGDRQKRIVEAVWPALKPGGHLIYSTCTYNRVENEDLIDWVIEELNAQPINIITPPSWKITTSESELGATILRCYPHLTQSEGFAISALQKPLEGYNDVLPNYRNQKGNSKEISACAGWLTQPDRYTIWKEGNYFYAFEKSLMPFLFYLEKSLRVVHKGITLGEWIKNDLIPHHQLAISTALNQDSTSCIDFDSIHDAVKYVAKETITTPIPQGIQLARFKHIPLGWIKGIGNRSNNLYPMNWRIRMDMNELATTECASEVLKMNEPE